MTEPRLTLHGVSYVLPTGKTLFSDLSASFGAQRTGLVGRNGVGKSLLARILAGETAPSSGSVARSGRVHYLAQDLLQTNADQTVATLASLQPTFDALARIEQGSCADHDYELLAERWDIRPQLQAALHAAHLTGLHADAPTRQLSCGQAMRVALVGAQLSGADFLILDEPSNHLDAAHRSALAMQLRHWRGGLLLISHDRSLLNAMDCMAELASNALTFYGGSYDFYLNSKRQQEQAALQTLTQAKLERDRQERSLHEQQQRQQRQQAAANRAGKNANQAKLLLGTQKARSQATAGRLAQQQTQAREAAQQRVREAAQSIDWQAASIYLHVPPLQELLPPERVVTALDAVQLPWSSQLPAVSLRLQAGQRIAITGPNGCGKSTLLRVLAGEIEPLQGRRQMTASFAWLDQRLSSLDDELSVITQLQQAAPRTPQGLQRMRLAQLGLNASHMDQPCRLLSGGERLKAALACALYRDAAPQMLLLDEPDNHLDLPSQQALQAMLCQYPGTLVLVSHDEALLQALQLTHRLAISEAGWELLAV
ncbi:ABC-F family ATP-binding cassette domain-containing protein [Comamonas sp. lk]|uniref:ABC-F family ATP-binding cassette domain-containing protein n=1 Tax=Comamonas sp. lk TaxID=2201272 RepID=UPI000EB494CF|nr:ABC-F family ATP-binding cassette domain-containing protein [Comamonas sp. lk]